MKWILIAVMIILVMGCQKEESNFIESELLTYFDRFEEVAAERGIQINLADIDISAYINDIENRGTLGTCTSYTDGSQVINVDERYWDRADDLDKEYLVFHELGHCILDRDHDNSKDASGFCNSIMQSGSGDCRSTYSSSNRTQLLDELFAN